MSQISFGCVKKNRKKEGRLRGHALCMDCRGTTVLRGSLRSPRIDGEPRLLLIWTLAQRRPPRLTALTLETLYPLRTRCVLDCWPVHNISANVRHYSHPQCLAGRKQPRWRSSRPTHIRACSMTTGASAAVSPIRSIDNNKTKHSFS
jgi:hypothetical protein